MPQKDNNEAEPSEYNSELYKYILYIADKQKIKKNCIYT